MSILITDIRRHGHTKLFDVCSETGVEFIANEKFLNDNGILRHTAFDDEDFETLKAKAQLIHGIRTAVSVLELKDRSRKELLQKLKEKEIPDDVAVMAADYVRDKGYQDDYRYGLRLAQISARSYGKMRTQEALYHHGIARETARQICDEVYADENACAEQIDETLEKAARGIDLHDPAARNKLFAKLARRGYGSSEISAAMRRLAEKRKDEQI